MNAAIEKLKNDFVVQLTTVVQEAALERLRGVMENLGVPKAGKVIKFSVVKAVAAPKAPTKPRKKGPIQLCPVPGCRSPAAPIFGMLCSKHKATPKKLVAKYREARRVKKAA